MDDKPSRSWFWYLIGLVALFGVALIVLGSGKARAQQPPPCSPVGQVLAQFEDKFKEVPVWGAESKQGFRILILQSPGGQTYSMFQVRQGIACLIDAGDRAVVPSQPPETDKGA